VQAISHICIQGAIQSVADGARVRAERGHPPSLRRPACPVARRGARPGRSGFCGPATRAHPGRARSTAAAPSAYRCTKPSGRRPRPSVTRCPTGEGCLRTRSCRFKYVVVRRGLRYPFTPPRQGDSEQSPNYRTIAATWLRLHYGVLGEAIISAMVGMQESAFVEPGTLVLHQRSGQYRCRSATPSIKGPQRTRRRREDGLSRHICREHGQYEARQIQCDYRQMPRDGAMIRGCC
jgi:hypothetical protein